MSPSTSEGAVLPGIGNTTPIETIRLYVALQTVEKPDAFSFSRKWTEPRTIIHLATGQLALSNITFLIADEELARKDLLIGFPVLQYLQVNTRTLFERNHSQLDDADCTEVYNPTLDERSGTVSPMMICRLNRLQNDVHSLSSHEEKSRSLVHYAKLRTERNPFPDTSLLDPIDSDPHEDIAAAINHMKSTAKANGLSD